MQTTTTSLAAAFQLYETEFLAARNLAFRSRREYLNDLKDLLVYLTSVAGVSDPGAVSKRLCYWAFEVLGDQTKWVS